MFPSRTTYATLLVMPHYKSQRNILLTDVFYFMSEIYTDTTEQFDAAVAVELPPANFVDNYGDRSDSATENDEKTQTEDLNSKWEAMLSNRREIQPQAGSDVDPFEKLKELCASCLIKTSCEGGDLHADLEVINSQPSVAQAIEAWKRGDVQFSNKFLELNGLNFSMRYDRPVINEPAKNNNQPSAPDIARTQNPDIEQISGKDLGTETTQSRSERNPTEKITTPESSIPSEPIEQPAAQPKLEFKQFDAEELKALEAEQQKRLNELTENSEILLTKEIQGQFLKMDGGRLDIQGADGKGVLANWDASLGQEMLEKYGIVPLTKAEYAAHIQELYKEHFTIIKSYNINGELMSVLHMQLQEDFSITTRLMPIKEIVPLSFNYDDDYSEENISNNFPAQKLKENTVGATDAIAANAINDKTMNGKSGQAADAPPRQSIFREIFTATGIQISAAESRTVFRFVKPENADKVDYRPASSSDIAAETTSGQKLSRPQTGRIAKFDSRLIFDSRPIKVSNIFDVLLPHRLNEIVRQAELQEQTQANQAKSEFRKNEPRNDAKTPAETDKTPAKQTSETAFEIAGISIANKTGINKTKEAGEQNQENRRTTSTHAPKLIAKEKLSHRSAAAEKSAALAKTKVFGNGPKQPGGPQLQRNLTSGETIIAGIQIAHENNPAPANDEIEQHAEIIRQDKTIEQNEIGQPIEQNQNQALPEAITSARADQKIITIVETAPAAVARPLQKAKITAQIENSTGISIKPARAEKIQIAPAAIKIDSEQPAQIRTRERTAAKTAKIESPVIQKIQQTIELLAGLRQTGNTAAESRSAENRLRTEIKTPIEMPHYQSSAAKMDKSKTPSAETRRPAEFRGFRPSGAVKTATKSSASEDATEKSPFIPAARARAFRPVSAAA